MPVQNPDPDPRRSTGLEPGGGVPPGETPPAEASTSSGAGPWERRRDGWAKGPLFAIVLITLMFAGFFLGYAFFLAR
ncbi:DUF6480 family protein [Streptomyces sp. XM4193]|uniref:DUF6480 family protein n=1 Tax=Streptomyces sp. XM4193 TaxID=2929782 RepID=UPI001FF85989|nr:DUF6480 family protein [Streptomyces sp. XM4193]MCK1797451.1 DUF6480 family protein [Streptomyces sp. XM4193]